MKKIRLIKQLMIGGQATPAGSEVAVSIQIARELVARGAAVNVIEGDTDGDGKLDADEKKAKREKKTKSEPEVEA